LRVLCDVGQRLGDDEVGACLDRGGDLGAVDEQAAGLGLAQVTAERGVVAQRALGAMVSGVAG
jgi:hypothetical protein